MVSENTFKDNYSIKRGQTYASILVGSLLCGFSVYAVLSHLLVPFKIVVPISIIISILVFGVSKNIIMERKNDSDTITNEYRRSPSRKIILVIIYVVFLIISYSSGPSNDIFVPWQLLTLTQIIKLIVSISLLTVLPGYAILYIAGLEQQLSTLPKFLIAYIVSVFVTGFTSYSLASVGLAISDCLMIFNLTYTAILGTLLLRMALKREFTKSFSFDFNFKETIRLNSSEILVFGSLFAFVVLSTYYLYDNTIIGDQWYHHGRALSLFTGTFKDFYASGLDSLEYPPFTSAFLASLFTLSNTPSVNSYVAIDFLNIIPLVAFYYFFTKWFPNYKRAALLATALFMLSSGFGWIYVLNLVSTNPIITIPTAMQIFQDAGTKTFDVWLPNTFLNVGHPDITSPLILFCLPAGFVLLGLLKENFRSNFKYLALIAVVSLLGIISHDEFVLFMIVGSIIPIIFALKDKISIYAGLLLSCLVIFLLVIFFPGQYYTYEKIFGVELPYLYLSFISATGVLYASKILPKLYLYKINTNKIKKNSMHTILFIVGVTLVSTFSYFYILSFIIWNIQIPYFDVRVNTDDFKTIPWHFLPLRFGIIGAIGFACLFSYFFKKFEKEIFVLALFAIVAFLVGPYYNEHRIDKYIMSSFAGLSSILLYKILITPKKPLVKSLISGLVIGAIITTSSFSVLMYVGYTALALENPNSGTFNDDLPRRHFPNNFSMLNFLHQNINLKSDNIAIPLNESRINQGLMSELEGFVGMPSARLVQNSALETSSLEGLYTLLNQSDVKYIVFPESFIEKGLSQSNQFVLENFQNVYHDNNDTVMSVPKLSPPSENSDVTLILNSNDYIKIFSSKILNYSDNAVFDTSQLILAEENNVIIYNKGTVWSRSIINDTGNLIDSNFKFIDENSIDNHAGIVWNDGKKDYYVFLRPDRIIVSTPEVGEIASAPIKRTNEIWHNLRILFYNNKINIYFDSELKISTNITSSSEVNFSKVGLRVYNSIVEFRPISIDIGKPINVDPKFNYEYPLNALALSGIKYNVLSDNDVDIFTKKTIFLSFDPVDIDKYTQFIKDGGTAIIFESDDKLNGGFSNFLDIHPGDTKEFDQVGNEQELVKMSGFVRNVQINSGVDVIKSYYMLGNQQVAPFIIEKYYGNGKLIFVNTSGYFTTVSESPQKFFLTLGEILKMTGIDHVQPKKEVGLSTTPAIRFVGDFQATGSIQIKSSSLIISPSNSFNIIMTSQNHGKNDILSENQTSLQATGLQILGPVTTTLNTSSVYAGLSSEHGYIPLYFPNGFNMLLQIPQESHVQIFTGNSTKPIMISSEQIQDGRIEVIPTSKIDPTSKDFILMKTPIIQINGTTSFDKLHSTDPNDPTQPWADGIPVTISGTFEAKFDHLDVKPYDLKKSITYLDWIKVNGTTNMSIKSSKKILEIPWTEAMDSALNIRLQIIIPVVTVIMLMIWKLKRKNQQLYHNT